MIDFCNYRSLEEALASTMLTCSGLKELAGMNAGTIEKLSQLIISEDWYGDKKLIESTVSTVWKTSSIEPFITHSIWCAQREANWLLNLEKTQNLRLQYQFYKPEYLIQTQKKPTVVITPMSLATHDAIDIVLEVLNRFDPERKVIFYGENMQYYLELHPEHKKLFASSNVDGMKRIIQTLRSGGLFITYPDFVYTGHQSIQGELFGTKRSFSSSFLKLILKRQAALLPMTIVKSGEELHMRFYPGIPACKIAKYNMLPDSARIQLQCLLISKILEGLIVQVPNQWRLLTTLTHQAVEMA